MSKVKSDKVDAAEVSFIAGKYVDGSLYGPAFYSLTRQLYIPVNGTNIGWGIHVTCAERKIT